MSQNLSLLTLSIRASGAVTARRGVGFDGAQAGQQGQKIQGVALTAADDGRILTIAAAGTVSVESGDAFAVGDSLIVDAQGRAIPATGALAIVAGATPVTSGAAAGAEVLTGADLPEYVFADALEAATGPGQVREVLLRR